MQRVTEEIEQLDTGFGSQDQLDSNSFVDILPSLSSRSPSASYDASNAEEGYEVEPDANADTENTAYHGRVIELTTEAKEICARGGQRSVDTSCVVLSSRGIGSLSVARVSLREHIRFLDLSDNMLSSPTILCTLATLTHLSSLSLACNRLWQLLFTDDVLEKIESGRFYASLAVLDLGYNQLHGESLVPISALPALKRLNVCHNAISLIPFDAKFPQLASLDLSSNDLVQPSQWRPLKLCAPALSELSLANNRIRSVFDDEHRELTDRERACPPLFEDGRANCMLASLQPFPSLTTVDLSNNCLSGSSQECGLRQLKRMCRALTGITLHGNRGIVIYSADIASICQTSSGLKAGLPARASANPSSGYLGHSKISSAARNLLGPVSVSRIIQPPDCKRSPVDDLADLDSPDTVHPSSSVSRLPPMATPVGKRDQCIVESQNAPTSYMREPPLADMKASFMLVKNAMGRQVGHSSAVSPTGESNDVSSDLAGEHAAKSQFGSTEISDPVLARMIHTLNRHTSGTDRMSSEPRELSTLALPGLDLVPSRQPSGFGQSDLKKSATLAVIASLKKAFNERIRALANPRSTDDSETQLDAVSRSDFNEHQSEPVVKDESQSVLEPASAVQVIRQVTDDERRLAKNILDDLRKARRAKTRQILPQVRFGEKR